jgi:hypothetical protein
MRLMPVGINMHNKEKVMNRLYRAVELYRELGFEYLPLKKGDVEGFLTRSEGSKTYPSPQLKEEAAACNKTDGLKALRDKVGECKKCKLSGNRNNIVFGEGQPDAEIMFIGE